MSKGNVKTVLVIAFLVTASLSLPLMANAKDPIETSQAGLGGVASFANPNSLWGGMGSAMQMFGQFGFAGAVLGQLMSIIFTQGLEIESRESLPGVFMLNASIEETNSVKETYGSSNGTSEYWIPEFYYRNTNLTTYYNSTPYCVVNKSGTVNMTFTMGAAVTIVLWDSDRSFITALQKVIDFGQVLFKASNDMKSTDANYQSKMTQLAGEALEVISYLLIHINDIFNGDELFMMNPITWQTLSIKTEADFEINKTWFYEDDGPQILNTSWIDDWNWSDTADVINDEYMEFLLDPYDSGVIEHTWTHFSFDLIQLWIKNFYISIDAAEIITMLTNMMPTSSANGDDSNPFASTQIANLFDGCDIEFYLFTHHLTGAFLYNDANDDKKISVTYEPLKNYSSSTNETIFVDGKPVMIPKSSEVTHRIMYGEIGQFKYVEPHLNTKDGVEQISWGINLTNIEIAAVPLGMRMEDYIGSGSVPVEELDYAYFGFSFIPNITATLEKDDGSLVSLASARVKLDQYFAPWNNADGVPNVNGDIGTSDLAIIYLSTVLHVHLNLSVDAISAEKALGYDDDDALLTDDDYNETTSELFIGNYMTDIAETPFVDIAGPYFKVGLTEATALPYKASTSLIPLALFQAGVNDFSTHVNEDDVSNSFTTDLFISVEANALLYSVNYWEFNGTGNGIWHDPVFSVYMTWTTGSVAGVLLLLGGITLVGVATILITRKKNKAIR